MAAAAQTDAGRTAGVNVNAVLAIVAAAQFMVILDASIVNVALPTIKRDVGFSEQSLSWILNAYTLIFGGFLLLGGRLADRLGGAGCSWPASRCSQPHRSSAASPSPRASSSSPAGFRGWAGRWCHRLHSRSS
jgi:MFS family permease